MSQTNSHNPLSNAPVSRVDGIIAQVRARSERRDAAVWEGVPSGGGSAQFFPVLVTKDGGADGSGTTKASWTYTVSTLDGTEIDTSIQQARPRENGSKTCQSGETSYGVAFYDADGELKLWDAGEVANTKDCIS